VSVSLFFVNKQSVSWSFVCQFKDDMFFAPSHNNTEQFVITTRLGRMKAWAACNSLDWVTCYPLHFTLAYIVYQESRTLWRPQWNVHWNWQSFDWFVTLLHYLFFNKKK